MYFLGKMELAEDILQYYSKELAKKAKSHKRELADIFSKKKDELELLISKNLPKRNLSLSEIIVIDKLGEGGYGSVYRVSLKFFIQF